MRKPFLISACAFLVHVLGYADNVTTSNLQHNCICFDEPSISDEEAFRRSCVSLEIPLRQNTTNAFLREARQPFLDRIFLSFKDPQSDPILYRLLIEKLIFIAYRSPESLEKEIENNSLDWQDFKAFFEFYAPETDRYNALPMEEQRHFINYNGLVFADRF